MRYVRKEKTETVPEEHCRDAEYVLNILREKKIWDLPMAEGINKNYMWFLGNYPQSSDVEMKKLLLEMIRLQPDHPNFSSFKFKACCSLLGKNRTLDFWIYRYKARQQSNK